MAQLKVFELLLETLSRHSSPFLHLAGTLVPLSGSPAGCITRQITPAGFNTTRDLSPGAFESITVHIVLMA